MAAKSAPLEPFGVNSTWPSVGKPRLPSLEEGDLFYYSKSGVAAFAHSFLLTSRIQLMIRLVIPSEVEGSNSDRCFDKLNMTGNNGQRILTRKYPKYRDHSPH